MRRRLAALLLLPALCGAGEPAAQRLQTITVKPGDTLWSIANRYLMDPARWDEILKHNKLPSSDPTVALPGMSLRVPIRLIKAHLRAAEISYALNKVDSRRRETAQWNPVKQADQVFEGDSVRTLEGSKAKVRFLNDDMLSIDANSLVIIKPPAADYDVELKRGGVFVGRSRVITASARITPRTKDTEYSAKVRQDLSTLVEVYKGQASVDAQGQTVDVSAGMATEVKLGLAPAVPKRIADLPEFEARAAEFSRSRVAGGASLPQAFRAPAAAAPEVGARDIDSIGGDMQSLSIGMPVAGFRVQASRGQEFSKLVFDKTFDVDEKPYLKDSLPAGVYWWRIAVIDLLGTEGPFSPPRLYSLGAAPARAQAAAAPQEQAFILTRPWGEKDAVDEPSYLVKGRVKDERASVLVNDKPARVDEAGNFQALVKLDEGDNPVVVRVVDAAGATTTLTRTITYNPR